MVDPNSAGTTQLQVANDRIGWLRGYETEAELVDAAQEIVKCFTLDTFVFGASSRIFAREQYRYLIGCAPEWCYAYNQNKWYAIDPCLEYSLGNTAPILTSALKIVSPGQARLMSEAAKYGFAAGVVVPAHSGPTGQIGVLYLGTAAGDDVARSSFDVNRNLMRALALELLECWHHRRAENARSELELDEVDFALLTKALEGATAEEAAAELGFSIWKTKSRYERLTRKLNVNSKREAAEKAVALGLIRRSS